MNRSFVSLLALVVVLTAACKHQDNSTTAANTTTPDGTRTDANTAQGVPSNLWFSLKREGCRGFCPKYTLTVLKDGTAKLLGERGIELTGMFQKTLTDTQKAKLTNLFQSPDFFLYNNRYEDTLVADIPGVFITLVRGGQQKMVYARDNVPEALQKLILDIEEVVDLNNGYTIVNDPTNER